MLLGNRLTFVSAPSENLAAAEFMLGRHMNLLEIVKSAWAFTGLSPRSVVDVNEFGNLLVDDFEGRVWLIRPEELSCRVVASSLHDLELLRETIDFKEDWAMERLVETATALFGTPFTGRCFCLKIPAVLGGTYLKENLGTISVEELVAASGNMAEQIKDMPDETKVNIKIVY
jgi:hypothetical protein